MEAENQFGRVWGLGLECCPGVWLGRRGYQPLVATSQMLKIDFLQLTWIIVGDELVRVQVERLQQRLLQRDRGAKVAIVLEGVPDCIAPDKSIFPDMGTALCVVSCQVE